MKRFYILIFDKVEIINRLSSKEDTPRTGKVASHILGRSDLIVLSHIIELITGKSIDEYLQDADFTYWTDNIGHYSIEKEK
ncbi:hypothetical protein [Aquiflexum sp.]|uniref:hypothetical protein n=1 Tax=Aquiflexum sp. TaxID=1872584 RepID=UPI003593D5C7